MTPPRPRGDGPKPTRIICIGNSLVSHDSAGPRVFHSLSQRPDTAGVEIVDGGLLGLSLLPSVMDAARVVFVDQLEGFGEPGEVLVLDEAALCDGPAPDVGHGGSLAYLIRAAVALRSGAEPELFLVGIEGEASDEAIRVASDRALLLAHAGQGGTP